MIALAEKVYEDALDLSIIDRLLHSTNLPTQVDIDKAWALEVEQRSNQIENGTAKLIPGEEIFSKIKDRLAK